jgi:hypothetical protein
MKENTENDDDLYGMLQASTILSKNPYAAAYLEPELNDLNSFDSILTATPHVYTDISTTLEIANTTQAVVNVYSAYNGSLTFETDLYWTIYVSTAFECDALGDGDPDNEDAPDYFHSCVGYTGISSTMRGALVFMESQRDDYVRSTHSYSLADAMTETTVHEIGHEFGLNHRSNNTIMNGKYASQKAKYMFDINDIALLRLLKRPYLEP